MDTVQRWDIKTFQKHFFPGKAFCVCPSHRKINLSVAEEYLPSFQFPWDLTFVRERKEIPLFPLHFGLFPTQAGGDWILNNHVHFAASLRSLSAHSQLVSMFLRANIRLAGAAFTEFTLIHCFCPRSGFSRNGIGIGLWWG